MIILKFTNILFNDSFFFKDIIDYELPTSDEIKPDSDYLIEREVNYLSKIVSAFETKKIVILKGCGKKTLVLQYAKSIKNFFIYNTKEKLAEFVKTEMDKERKKDLEKILEKNLNQNFLFIFNEPDINTKDIQNFINNASQNYQKFFFILLANQDQDSILKEIFSAEEIVIDLFSLNESEKTIRGFFKKQYPNDEVDELDSNIDDLFDFENSKTNPKPKTNPKDLKKIIKYIEEKSYESLDYIKKHINELKSQLENNSIIKTNQDNSDDIGEH